MPLFWSFFVRDYRTEISYRLSFLLSVTGVFISTFSYYFMSLLFGDDIPALAPYGGDYFSFVIIGIAFGGYFGVGLNGFSRAIRQAQTTGTLEAMLMTPASLSSIIIGSSLWSYAFSTFRVFLYLALGTLVLGLRFENANYLGAVVSLLLSVVAFASLGIIAASVIMVIKRGDPVTGLFSSLAMLVGGVLFPVEILPPWLQFIAALLPITYAMEAMRLSLLTGAEWAELWPQILALLIFCLVLGPISLFSFRYAVRRARAEGTLAHY